MSLFGIKQYLPFTGVDDHAPVINKPVQFKNRLSDTARTALKSKIDALLSDYNDVLDSSSFDEIHQFAIRTKKLSTSYKIPILENYAENMIEACKNFDIEAITEYVTILPNLFKQILDEITK